MSAAALTSGSGLSVGLRLGAGRKLAAPPCPAQFGQVVAAVRGGQQVADRVGVVQVDLAGQESGGDVDARVGGRQHGQQVVQGVGGDHRADPAVGVVECDGGPPGAGLVDGLEVTGRLDVLHSDGGDSFLVVAGVQVQHHGAAQAPGVRAGDGDPVQHELDVAAVSGVGGQGPAGGPQQGGDPVGLGQPGGSGLAEFGPLGPGDRVGPGALGDRDRYSKPN